MKRWFLLPVAAFLILTGGLYALVRLFDALQ